MNPQARLGKTHSIIKNLIFYKSRSGPLHEHGLLDGCVLDSRLPRDQHKPALDVAFSVFAAETRFSPSQRRAAVDRVCLPLLRMVATPALVEFFSCHIKAVMGHIEAKTPKVGVTIDLSVEMRDTINKFYINLLILLLYTAL